MSRAASARRRKGDYGKQNLRQHRVFMEDGEGLNTPVPINNLTNANPPRTRVNDLDFGIIDDPKPLKPLTGHPKLTPGRSLAAAIPASPSSTGYELMRIHHDFDIVDLSALATFHVGRATPQALASQPRRLIDVLRCRQWSYFSYLPSRYGHSTCLDDAIHCIAARV